MDNTRKAYLKSHLCEIIEIVKADMRKANIPFDDEAPFIIKPDSKPFGVCHISYNPNKGRFCSKIYIAEKSFHRDDAFLKNVVCHELIHSAPDCRGCGHRGQWKQYANKMNRLCLNYHITTTIAATEEECSTNAKYCIQCTSCKANAYFLKKGKLVKLVEAQANNTYHENIECMKCGGHTFQLKYLR